MPATHTTTERKSSYLQYLPAIYRDYALMGRFLLIFESIMMPIEHIVDNISSYFDPVITPGHFLSWLASWLDLSLDPDWPEDRCRELVASAAELYRWRGTKWGLSEYIRIYTGIEPEIHEYEPGMTLDGDTKLGSGTQLGSGAAWCHFTVVLPVDKGNKIDDTKVRTIIEAQKPAHSTYSLRLKPKGGD
jgi:phage tail-like protein